MRQPVHALNTGRREMTPERIVGIGFVALLHVVAIWAILSGLAQKVVRAVVPPDLIMVETHDKTLPPPPAPPQPPTVDVPSLATPQVPPPVIDIETTRPTIIDVKPVIDHQGPVAPTVPDTAAAGVTSTHTTPPYPMLDRRLNNQGTVKLRLTISPQGIVTAADVVQSSGFPGLDQAAIGWVLQHWKYKPAVQGGVPVASTTVAAVVFNIKNAG